MPIKDPNAAKANAKKRKAKYLLKKKIEKHGEANAKVDLRGKHTNHAKGERNCRWNGSDRRVLSHGYVAVRVPVDHPHAWGSSRLKNFKYAYEHIVVMMQHIGRPLAPDETVHHRNGDKTDNRIENLELMTRSEHAKEHTDVPGVRDDEGRFKAEVLRTVPSSGLTS